MVIRKQVVGASELLRNRQHKTKPSRDSFRLQDRLEELLDCPVDLGTPDSLKPRIRQAVAEECIDVA
jgi:predicted nucleotidyltransferase